MNVTISENLSAGRRDPLRFCATVENDERAGFGTSERNALWSLAQRLNIHPATIAATATIERLAVR